MLQIYVYSFLSLSLSLFSLSFFLYIYFSLLLLLLLLFMFMCLSPTCTDLVEKRERFPQGSSLVLYLYFRIFYFCIVELWALVNLKQRKKMILIKKLNLCFTYFLIIELHIKNCDQENDVGFQKKMLHKLGCVLTYSLAIPVLEDCLKDSCALKIL